jgi:hypothetical protein
MSESLGDKQRRFALRIADWMAWVFEQGYAITFGEGMRSDEQAEINALGAGRKMLCQFIAPHWPELARRIANNTGSGIRNTLHEWGLAHDFNLFRRNARGDWEYVTDGDSPEWRLAGRHWETMGADHCWGGRFGDGNHLSISHEGRK